jgi:hypothetical protein
MTISTYRTTHNHHRRRRRRRAIIFMVIIIIVILSSLSFCFHKKFSPEKNLVVIFLS